MKGWMGKWMDLKDTQSNGWINHGKINECILGNIDRWLDGWMVDK